MTRVVVKLGGAVAGGAATRALEVVRGGNEVVVVHGAGPQISSELERLGLPVEFVGGRRVTSREALDVVRASLLGVSAEVCAVLGPTAKPLVGDEIGLLASPLRELGLVGEPIPSRPPAIEAALSDGLIPVVAPIAVGPMNVNADEAASALAVGLEADRIVFVSDVPGVFVEGVLTERIESGEAHALLEAGAFEGGIVPKLMAAARAARVGIRAEIGVTEVAA